MPETKSQQKSDSTLKYRVRSLDRALDILECLAAEGPEMGLSEITAAVGLSKSTTHRLVAALAGRQYLRQPVGTGRYRLGLKLFELGLQAVDNDGLLALARPRLAGLVAATAETAHLGILRDGEVLSVCAVEGPKTLRTPSTVGRRSPAHATGLGKCLLAFSLRSQVESLLATHGLKRFTARTITAKEDLLRELERVRRLGYAVDNEEIERGLKCIAAPVFDATGQVRAAMSIAGPAGRLGGAESEVLIQAVKKAARALSADLGADSAELFAGGPNFNGRADRSTGRGTG